MSMRSTMVVKGEIPVIDEDYDLSSAGGLVTTGKNVVAAILGVSMLLGIVAAGRALWNRASEEVETVEEVEVF